MVKILLCDDHRILRQGLRALIEREPGFKVEGEADDGRTAVQMAIDLPVDLVITDVTMGGLNGMDATRQILHRKPQLKILALSMHTERSFISEMLRAGAAGYVLKDAAFEELAKAINTVMSGRTYLSPTIAGLMVDELARMNQSEIPAVSPFSSLTPREREVLQLVAEGNSLKQIGYLLGLSNKTVETHRRQVMEKLNLYSVAELTKYALREGLTTLQAEAQA